LINGLLLDGAGTGNVGILIRSGSSVQILNTVASHFLNGVFANAGNVTTIANSVLSNNLTAGLQTANSSTVFLAKSVISGNDFGVYAGTGTAVSSYGDNYIRDNKIPVSGTLTPVTTQ
jgi:hypothetical protein